MTRRQRSNLQGRDERMTYLRGNLVNSIDKYLKQDMRSCDKKIKVLCKKKIIKTPV